MITLISGKQQLQIEKGEVRSYQVDGYEFMHQPGSPGWGHTDTEMFPIIGPTAGAGFRVQVPKGNAVLDQHGLLRELDYSLQAQNSLSAHYQITYKAGTLVPNSKFPEKSTVPRLIWPYDFSFSKNLSLSPEGLQIEFRVSGERDMPFMLGYHPAFSIRNPDAWIQAGERRIEMKEIMEAGNRALEVGDCEEVVLHDRRKLHLKTENFGNFMLWSPSGNMLCIEPISFYPYAVSQQSLHQGFQYLSGETRNFRIRISPFGALE